MSTYLFSVTVSPFSLQRRPLILNGCETHKKSSHPTSLCWVYLFPNHIRYGLGQGPVLQPPPWQVRGRGSNGVLSAPRLPGSPDPGQQLANFAMFWFSPVAPTCWKRVQTHCLRGTASKQNLKTESRPSSTRHRAAPWGISARNSPFVGHTLSGWASGGYRGMSAPHVTLPVASKPD